MPGKNRTRMCIVISTIITGRKNYVIERAGRSRDHKVQVLHTNDPAKATVYDTIQEAQDTIEKIFNPVGRVYNVDNALIQLQQHQQAPPSSFKQGELF